VWLVARNLMRKNQKVKLSRAKAKAKAKQAKVERAHLIVANAVDELLKEFASECPTLGPVLGLILWPLLTMYAMALVMPSSEIMRLYHEGRLHSGPDGAIVHNPHQAKAILLSYLRKEGKPIPDKPHEKG
jgi:hypothetical protein